MKFDKKELINLLEEGKSSEDIVKEFTNALNAAEKEHKLEIQKAEARKKLREDYTDDLAALLVKLCDDLGLDFKGSDLMDYAAKTIERFDSVSDIRRKRYEDAGWTVEVDECKKTPHGYTSYFKAYKRSK